MRRRKSPIEPSPSSSPPKELEDNSPSPLEKQKEARNSTQTTTDTRTSSRVAKWAMLRLLGGTYLMAFLGALFQNKGLIGSNGIAPADVYMKHLRSSAESKRSGFLSHPTLFWWIPLSDTNMDFVAIAGTILSIAVILGLNSWLCMLALWLLDFSIVTLGEGTSFYSYGWESQLLETGFLAIFLCDLPSVVLTRNSDNTDSYGGGKREWRISSVWKDSERNSSPSSIVLWLYRWLCFRISIGAGLIKIRGSSCWTQKTCLHYHFETQPIPSPLSFAFHFLPKTMLTHAVDLDLFVQLYTSWFVLVPSFNTIMVFIRRTGGFIQAGFMINIILSGNLAFLPHMTIIPALASLDESCWPRWLRRYVCGESLTKSTPSSSLGTQYCTLPIRRMIDTLLLLLIAGLSLPVVTNLLQWKGSRQRMNASFESFRLVNTYGAFGSVGERRYEAIISVSHDGVNWTELDLPCKPGSLSRRPCFCAPYHYRLDWNIWFLGFKPHRAYLQNRESWLYNLLAKILDDESVLEDRPWLDLLDKESHSFLRDRYRLDETKPMLAKVDMYEYRMADSLWNILAASFRGENVVWWNRRFEESLIPPVRLNRSNKRLEYAQ